VTHAYVCNAVLPQLYICIQQHLAVFFDPRLCLNHPDTTYVITRNLNIFWNWIGVVQFSILRCLIWPKNVIDTFFIAIFYKLCRCDHWVFEFRIISNINKSDQCKQNKTLKQNALQTIFLYQTKCRQDLFMDQNALQTKLMKHNARQAIFFLTESWWVVCPFDVVIMTFPKDL